MLTDFLSDTGSYLMLPQTQWQLAAIVLCVLASLGLSRAIRHRFTAPPPQPPQFAQLSARSFGRMWSPLLILFFLLLARIVLAHTHHPVDLLQIVIPLSLSLTLMRVGFYLLHRIFVRDSGVGSLLRLFEKLFAALIWVGVTLYITGLWPDLLTYLDQTVIPLGRNQPSLLTILQATATVVITLIIAMWAGAALEDRLMQLNTMHSSLRTVVARMARAVLILAALLISLSIVGIDLTVLSVFGGALGVGLGLGMQKIASSYVSGFVILLERSMSIGDMVNVDRYFGKVTQINTRYTILEGLDGIESVLPNDLFMTNPVENYSLTHRILRLSTKFTILYQEDIDSVLSLLEKAASEVPRVSREILPQSYLAKIGPDGLELEVGFWITDPENGRLNVLSDVNRAIWRALHSNGIKIAHPKRDVRVMDARSFEQNPEGGSPQSPSGA
jgi:small-conductance mechanosensitive channel